MKINVESMSLADLKALNAKVSDAIVKAREREKSALKQEMAALAASHGLKLSEIFEAKSTRRAVNLTPWKDKKTGVLWSGRGRYPHGFEKARAEQLR